MRKSFKKASSSKAVKNAGSTAQTPKPQGKKEKYLGSIECIITQILGFSINGLLVPFYHILIDGQRYVIGENRIGSLSSIENVAEALHCDKSFLAALSALLLKGSCDKSLDKAVRRNQLVYSETVEKGRTVVDVFLTSDRRYYHLVVGASRVIISMTDNGNYHLSFDEEMVRDMANE